MDIEKAKQIKAKMISELHDGLYYRFGSDNTILFTIEMYALFQELGIFDNDDAERLHKAIRKLGRRASGGTSSDIIPGLYNRKPGQDDRKEQWDNYEAISTSAVFGDDFRKYSEEILRYGRKFLWYSYDNRSPNKFSVHSFWKPFFNWRYFECCRQGWNVFTYQVNAKETPNPFYYLWFVGKILLENDNPQDTSGKLITWLRFRAIGNKWYIKPLKWMFDRKIKRIYKDGIAGAFKVYHGVDSDIYKLAACL